MQFEQLGNAFADFGLMFDTFNELTVSSNSSQSGETEIESLASPKYTFSVKGNGGFASKPQDAPIGQLQQQSFFDLAPDTKNNALLYQELEPSLASNAYNVSKLEARSRVPSMTSPASVSPSICSVYGTGTHSSSLSFPELNHAMPPPVSAAVDPKLQEKLHFQMLLQQKMMQQEQQMMNNHNLPVIGGLTNKMAIDNNRPGKIHLSPSESAQVHHSFSGPSPPHAQYASYKLPSPASVTRSLPQTASAMRGGVNPHMMANAYHRAGAGVFSSGSRPLVTSELPPYSVHQQQLLHQRSAPSMHSYPHQSQSQFPASGSMNQGFQAPQQSMNGTIYQIQFKCSVRYFTVGTQISASISCGDFVVVEADRGEDIGVVTEVLSMKAFVERRIMSNAYVVDDEESVVGRIIRVATLVERQTLAEKFRNEETVLQVCRELAYSTYRLPMSIHNVEYQFDRHKLTVHYSADSRIDFREFVRDLFSAYKARIWMKKVEPHKPVSFDPSAAMALATGMQFSC